jgi:hypothetical protein
VRYDTSSLTDVVHRPVHNVIGCPVGKCHDDSFLDIDSEGALRDSKDGGGES